MNIDQVVNYYPKSLQDSIRKELNERDFANIITKGISGELKESLSEPVARLLVAAINLFKPNSQKALICTALVGHDVLDSHPIKSLNGGVLSHIASLGEPLAIRILEGGFNKKGICIIEPSVVLELTKYHSCAITIFENHRNQINDLAISGCMRWLDIASREMLMSNFTLSKVAVAHFHHEFADQVAKLMVKNILQISHKEASYHSYKFSNFLTRVLPYVKDKSILYELVNTSFISHPEANEILSAIAINDPVGMCTQLKLGKLTGVYLESVKCKIAATDGGVKLLNEADLLRGDLSSDVALVLRHADQIVCVSFFEAKMIDSHTVDLLKDLFIQFKNKFESSNLNLKNPRIATILNQAA